MLFTIEDIKNLFDHYQLPAEETLEIRQIMTDSRTEKDQALFIPIIGDTFNGHDFVEQAIENGAIAVVWDEKEELPLSIPADFPIFFTDDTTKSLQDLAAYYRNLIDPKVIGITGSNGKTTTKDLVASIVKTSYRTHATFGNLNNHIGMPLTILGMPRDTEVLVLEMGMSEFGEIDLLTRIAKPDYAVITNIGESHIEYLGSREGIVQAKLEIVNGLQENGTLIIDGDEPLLQTIHINKNVDVLRCGFDKHNDLQILSADISVEGTRFTLSDGNTFLIPLSGVHHARNTAYAIQIAQLLGIGLKKQKEGLASLAHSSMRFELLDAIHDAVVVNDSYNASPTSMKAAIEVIKQMDGFKEKILVLGDVLELGAFADDMHRSIAEVIVPPITHLYTYGEKAKLITEHVRSDEIECRHFISKQELTAVLKKQLSKECLVLFKASRGLQFETMVEEIAVNQQDKDSN